MAGDDLTVATASQGKDEIALLLNALYAMQGSLSQVVHNVRQNADMVASASTQIAQGSHDLSQLGRIHGPGELPLARGVIERVDDGLLGVDRLAGELGVQLAGVCASGHEGSSDIVVEADSVVDAGLDGARRPDGPKGTGWRAKA